MNMAILNPHLSTNSLLKTWNAVWLCILNALSAGNAFIHWWSTWKKSEGTYMLRYRFFRSITLQSGTERRACLGTDTLYLEIG